MLCRHYYGYKQHINHEKLTKRVSCGLDKERGNGRFLGTFDECSQIGRLPWNIIRQSLGDNMKKYAIKKEFESLGYIKFPNNPALLPAANVCLRKIRGKSDAKVEVKECYIPGYQGKLIKVYMIEPKEGTKTNGCILDFHGGGFMLAASPGHFKRAKEYAYKLKCKVIFPDYRLSEEAKCPTALEDCYSVYGWILEHADKLGIDTKRIVVLGDSAGGNLAIGVSLLARDRNVQKPCFQLLIYPATDRRLHTESMKKYLDTPVWDARLSKLMWELYLKEKTTEYIEYVSPMEAASLAELPPAYVEVAEFDAIRDEGILYAKRLEKEGVPVELHEVKGAPHGYDNLQKSVTVRTLMKRRIALLREKLG